MRNLSGTMGFTGELNTSGDLNMWSMNVLKNILKIFEKSMKDYPTRRMDINASEKNGLRIFIILIHQN